MKTDFLGWVFFPVRFEASKKNKHTPWGFSRETPVAHSRKFNIIYILDTKKHSYLGE